MNRLTFISLLIAATEDRAVLETASVQEFNSLSSIEFLNFIRAARVNGVSDEVLLTEANRQIRLSEGDLQAMCVKEMEANNLLLQHQKLALEIEVGGLKAQLRLQKFETELQVNSTQADRADNLVHNILCGISVLIIAFTGGVLTSKVMTNPTNTATTTYIK